MAPLYIKKSGNCFEQHGKFNRITFHFHPLQVIARYRPRATTSSGWKSQSSISVARWLKVKWITCVIVCRRATGDSWQVMQCGQHCDQSVELSGQETGGQRSWQAYLRLVKHAGQLCMPFTLASSPVACLMSSRPGEACNKPYCSAKPKGSICLLVK